jgi:aldose 1-epimerase
LPLNFDDHPHSIHGVGWQSTWDLTKHTDTQVVLELSYDGAGWPFPFHASQTVTLHGADLLHEITMTNLAEAAMPAGLGWHPYFPRHGRAILRAAVDAVWLTDETCLPTERVPCLDHWDLSAGADVDDLRCDNQFEPWNRRAQIVWPEKSMSIEMAASAGLERLVVYAPAGDDFFCVEPVSHITNAFNRRAAGAENTGMRILAPGESWRAWMKLSPSAI